MFYHVGSVVGTVGVVEAVRKPVAFSYANVGAWRQRMQGDGPEVGR
jgi:hypothetical protein